MAFNTPAGTGYQNHHAIPVASGNKNALLKALAGAGLFNIDGEANRLRLPSSDTLADSVDGVLGAQLRQLY